MSYDKFWMIVNVSDSFDAPHGEKIPQSQAPRFMHPTKEQAEIELIRLQSNNRNCEFVLLEAMARAEERKVFVVEPINEIPF